MMVFGVLTSSCRLCAVFEKQGRDFLRLKCHSKGKALDMPML